MNNVVFLSTFCVTSCFHGFSLVPLHFNSAVICPLRKPRPITHYTVFSPWMLLMFRRRRHVGTPTHTHKQMYHTLAHKWLQISRHTLIIHLQSSRSTHFNLLYRTACTEVNLTALTNTGQERAHMPDLVWLHCNVLGLDGCPVCITLSNYMEMEK